MEGEKGPHVSRGISQGNEREGYLLEAKLVD